MKSEPLVSILVSTYNSAETIGALLQSVVEQSHKYIETIVVDNNSKDSTIEIAKQFTDRVYTQGPERSAQRNYAASMSNGEILIVLDSDMVLTREVVKEVVEKFVAEDEKLALIIPEESFGVGFWSACKRLERDFYVGIDWMEAARAFRRAPFMEMGGYDESNTGTEDYDLPHRLEEKHGRASIGRVAAFIKHNEGRLELIKSCKKKFYYARALDIYAKKEANKRPFANQSSPFKRFGLYFKSPQRLFKNPIVGGGMIYMKCCEMLSGMIGYALRHNSSSLQKSIYK